LVFSALKPLTLGGASLLFEWSGTDPLLEPMLLTAHQDVVPADPDHGWKHHPFQGVLSRGRVHGRGALDFKCGYAGILEACESLLEEGFRPERTVYLAMGHDEETGGARGAGAIAGHLENMGVTCGMAVDEGGYIHRLPWRRDRVAMVGIAEKGYATFSLTAKAVQGHASVPPGETVADMIAMAVIALRNNPFPVNPPGELQPLLASTGAAEVAVFPFGSALLRTTTAVTVMRAGEKENVLPAFGRILVNCRVIPGESIGTVERSLKALIDPLGLTVELIRDESLSEPSAVSPTDCAEYEAVKGAAIKCSGGLQVLPGIFVAATDSRHYSRVSRRVYRFLPVRLDERGVGMLHSVGESVSVRDYHSCVGFYSELIRSYC